MSSILAPDLFSCSIASMGVYDLELMFDKGDIPRNYGGKTYLRSALGTEKAELRAFYELTKCGRYESDFWGLDKR